MEKTEPNYRDRLAKKLLSSEGVLLGREAISEFETYRVPKEMWHFMGKTLEIKPCPAQLSQGRNIITLRTDGGQEGQLNLGKSSLQLALKWSRRISSRFREGSSIVLMMYPHFTEDPAEEAKKYNKDPKTARFVEVTGIKKFTMYFLSESQYEQIRNFVLEEE